jgi:hypothetical protein
MSCGLTQGFNDRACNNSKGGLKSVIFYPLANRTALTVTSNEVTTLTVTGEVYLYKLNRNLSSATYPSRGAETGAVWTEQSLNVVLNQDTKELRNEIHALTKNKEMGAIVEKADGTFIHLGLNEGLYVADGVEWGTGTARADRNGGTIVLVGQENDAVPDVDPTVVSTLLAQQSPSV